MTGAHDAVPMTLVPMTLVPMTLVPMTLVDPMVPLKTTIISRAKDTPVPTRTVARR
jgi:hypothetical protein